jgi:hypothetical protein
MVVLMATAALQAPRPREPASQTEHLREPPRASTQTPRPCMQRCTTDTTNADHGARSVPALDGTSPSRRPGRGQVDRYLHRSARVCATVTGPLLAQPVPPAPPFVTRQEAGQDISCQLLKVRRSNANGDSWWLAPERAASSHCGPRLLSAPGVRLPGSRSRTPRCWPGGSRCTISPQAGTSTATPPTCHSRRHPLVHNGAMGCTDGSCRAPALVACCAACRAHAYILANSSSSSSGSGRSSSSGSASRGRQQPLTWHPSGAAQRCTVTGIAQGGATTMLHAVHLPKYTERGTREETCQLTIATWMT